MATTGKAEALGIAFATLLAGRAAAQGPGFEVPADCGSEDEFRHELVRLVGPDAERAQPSSLSISRPTPSDDYRLTLTLGGEQRELTHADCRVLFRSALVIAAASVRPPASAELAEPPPAPAPTPAPAPAAPPTPDSPDSDSKARVSGSLSGGAGFAFGVLPGASAVFEVRSAILVGLFGFSFSGKYLPPRFVSSEGRGANIHAFGVRPAFLFAPIEQLSVSAGLDADLLIGQGTPGISAPGEDSAWTLAPSLELAVIPINTRHLALEIAVQGRVAVEQPVFEVTGFGEIYEVPPVGMLALARGVWHFP